MRRPLRLLLVGLFVAAGLPGVAIATPAQAQAMPDWNCDNSTPELTLITCADEAAFVGVSVAVFAGSYLPLLTAMGTAAFVDFVTGGMDYDQCLDELPGPLEHRCAGLPGDNDPGKGWVNKNPSDLPEGIGEGFCAVFPWWSSCSDPDPDQAGQHEYLLGGGESIHYGPAEAVWDDTYEGNISRKVGETWAFVLPVHTSSTTVVCWSNSSSSCSTSGRVQITSDYAVLSGQPSIRFRVSSSWGCCQERQSPWSQYQPVLSDGLAAFAIRTKAAVGSFDATYELVTPDGEGGANVVEWTKEDARLHHIGHEGWFAREHSVAGLRGISKVQQYLDMDLSALVEKIGRFDHEDERALPELEPVPAAPPESPFPVPPAPPAEPVPWPDAPSAPEAPEVDPAPEPDQYEEVSEGTGDEGLFDRLANRIGSAINNVVNAIGSVAGWVVGQLGALLEWLLDQIRELFQWLGDLLEGLLLWLGDLLKWLGELLQDVIDALEQMTGLLGWWFQGLIDAIFNAIGSLGDLLNASLQGLADLLSMLWDVLAQVPEFLGDILAGLLDLPAMIWEYLTGGLPSLDMPDMPSCEGIFPCSWVAEGSSAIDEFGGLLNGAGACTPPALGWSEFSVSFPAPSGCTSGNPGMDSGVESQAGNLFGFRVPLRIFAAFGLWLAFFRLILASTPWGKVDDVPLNPVNAAQGYRSLS